MLHRDKSSWTRTGGRDGNNFPIVGVHSRQDGNDANDGNVAVVGGIIDKPCTLRPIGRKYDTDQKKKSQVIKLSNNNHPARGHARKRYEGQGVTSW